MSGVINASLWFEGLPPQMSRHEKLNLKVSDYEVLDLLYKALMQFEDLQQVRDVLRGYLSIEPYHCDLVARRMNELQESTRGACESITSQGIFRSQTILRLLYNVEELTGEISRSVQELRVICLDQLREGRALQQEINEHLERLMDLDELLRTEVASLVLSPETEMRSAPVQ